jgi:hypothetical protein
MKSRRGLLFTLAAMASCCSTLPVLAQRARGARPFRPPPEGGVRRPRELFPRQEVPETSTPNGTEIPREPVVVHPPESHPDENSGCDGDDQCDDANLIGPE